MGQDYTKEEIKKLIHSNSVNASNLNDILNSLLKYDFDMEIREIFDKLADNPELPNSIRQNLERAVDAYDQIVEAKEQKEEESQKPEDGNASNGIQEHEEKVEVIEQPQEEQLMVQPLEESNVIEPEFKPVEIEGNFYDDTISTANSSYSNDDRIYLSNDMVLAGVTAYAVSKGINVMTRNPGIFEYPELSLELDENSKPYIDNLLLTLYDNKDDVNVSLDRIASSGKEVLTLKVDNPELSQAQLQEKGKQLFSNVEKILKETKEEKDYEASMPPELKALKDKFHNDDPKIPDADFKVGFSNSDGKSSYYLITNNQYEAQELASLMGYEIKKDRGGNVFEIDTGDRKMEGTKLDKVTEGINEIDEVKDPRAGISDVDINYNNNHYDNGEENYTRITSFIEDNRDPSTMSIVQVDVPENNPKQRIVSLASSDGTRETVVFNDGDEFDNALPKIANVYGNGENTSIDSSNVVKVDYNNGTSSYEALSSDNTYLRLNNLSPETVDSVNNKISNYVVTEEKVNTNQKDNNYVKTIGTYPTNNYNQAANTSFLTLLVFILIVVLGIIIVYAIYGG